MLSKSEIREKIVASFKNEVSYIQGTINSDTDECRSRRWKSLHTVVGILGYHFGLEGLPEEIGFVSLRKKESGDAES